MLKLGLVLGSSRSPRAALRVGAGEGRRASSVAKGSSRSQWAAAASIAARLVAAGAGGAD